MRAGFVVSADWTGLEPATSAVTGRQSNQLNYQSKLLLFNALGIASRFRKECKDKGRLLICQIFFL